MSDDGERWLQELLEIVQRDDDIIRRLSWHFQYLNVPYRLTIDNKTAGRFPWRCLRYLGAAFNASTDDVKQRFLLRFIQTDVVVLRALSSFPTSDISLPTLTEFTVPFIDAEVTNKILQAITSIENVRCYPRHIQAPILIRILCLIGEYAKDFSVKMHREYRVWRACAQIRDNFYHGGAPHILNKLLKFVDSEVEIEQLIKTLNNAAVFLSDGTQLGGLNYIEYLTSRNMSNYVDLEKAHTVIAAAERSIEQQEFEKLHEICKGSSKIAAVLQSFKSILTGFTAGQIKTIARKVSKVKVEDEFKCKLSEAINAEVRNAKDVLTQTLMSTLKNAGVDEITRKIHNLQLDSELEFIGQLCEASLQKSPPKMEDLISQFAQFSLDNDDYTDVMLEVSGLMSLVTFSGEMSNDTVSQHLLLQFCFEQYYLLVEKLYKKGRLVKGNVYDTALLLDALHPIRCELAHNPEKLSGVDWLAFIKQITASLLYQIYVGHTHTPSVEGTRIMVADEKPSDNKLLIAAPRRLKLLCDSRHVLRLNVVTLNGDNGVRARGSTLLLFLDMPDNDLLKRVSFNLALKSILPRKFVLHTREQMVQVLSHTHTTEQIEQLMINSIAVSEFLNSEITRLQCENGQIEYLTAEGEARVAQSVGELDERSGHMRVMNDDDFYALDEQEREGKEVKLRTDMATQHYIAMDARKLAGWLFDYKDEFPILLSLADSYHTTVKLSVAIYAATKQGTDFYEGVKTSPQHVRRVRVVGLGRAMPVSDLDHYLADLRRHPSSLPDGMLETVVSLIVDDDHHVLRTLISKYRCNLQMQRALENEFMDACIQNLFSIVGTPSDRKEWMQLIGYPMVFSTIHRQCVRFLASRRNYPQIKELLDAGFHPAAMEQLQEAISVNLRDAFSHNTDGPFSKPTVHGDGLVIGGGTMYETRVKNKQKKHYDRKCEILMQDYDGYLPELIITLRSEYRQSRQLFSFLYNAGAQEQQRVDAEIQSTTDALLANVYQEIVTLSDKIDRAANIVNSSQDFAESVRSLFAAEKQEHEALLQVLLSKLDHHFASCEFSNYLLVIAKKNPEWFHLFFPRLESAKLQSDYESGTTEDRVLEELMQLFFHEAIGFVKSRAYQSAQIDFEKQAATLAWRPA